MALALLPPACCMPLSNITTVTLIKGMRSTFMLRRTPQIASTQHPLTCYKSCFRQGLPSNPSTYPACISDSVRQVARYFEASEPSPLLEDASMRMFLGSASNQARRLHGLWVSTLAWDMPGEAHGSKVFLEFLGIIASTSCKTLPKHCLTISDHALHVTQNENNLNSVPACWFNESCS